MREWSFGDRCKGSLTLSWSDVAGKAVQSLKDPSGSSVLMVQGVAVLTSLIFCWRGERAVRLPQGYQLASCKHIILLFLSRKHIAIEMSKTDTVLWMLENSICQTCKSFTYFSSLLVVANCLQPQKQNECITSKPCYPAIKGNCLKKQSCFLITRFPFKWSYTDSMIILLSW